MSTPRFLPRRGDDAGFSVMELVVVTMLLSLVSAMIFGFLNHATEIAAKQTLNERAEQELVFAMRELTANLRSAETISETYPTTGTCPAGGSFASSVSYAGYANCVRFTILRPTTAGADCPRSEITYGLVGQQLRLDRVDYVLNSGSCVVGRTTTGFTLVTNVANTSGTPVFTYYDRDGNNLLTGTPRAPKSAASIRVTVQKTYHRNGTTLDFSEVVALRNKR